MAIGAATHWAYDSGATASNVNGGGFNTGNANFITDYAATLATGNAPVITSATYTFVAGDVNAWIYVKAGTSWTPGFYKITAVNGGAATVNATIGAAVQLSNGRWIPNTVAGCATVASPTGGTCGIDFSQSTAAIINGTDLACADADLATPVVTSAGTPFSVRYIGNIIHVTAGTGYTAGWYEIVSVSGANATLDRAVGTDGAKTDGTFYVGGAISLGAADDDAALEIVVAGNNVWIKSGTYTLGATVTLSSAGTGTVAIECEGFETVRGDRPLLSTRPLIVVGTTTMTSWPQSKLRNIQWITTAGQDPFVCITLGIGSVAIDCKATHIGPTAARAAWYLNVDSRLIRCEGICYLGRAVNTDGSSKIIDCYFHHSQTGVRLAATALSQSVIGCIIESCTGIGISFASANSLNSLIYGNTIYGGETAQGTAGIFITAASSEIMIIGNIIYGWTTGVSHGTAGQTMGIDMFNCYYNNTTNATNWNLGMGSTTTAVTFKNVTQETGTTGTTASDILTDATANFNGVTVNQDYCEIISGTGVTPSFYLITAKTATTITLSPAPGNNATADKVYRVTMGRNFTPTSVSAIGTNGPGVFPGGIQTGYKDVGAIQRLEDYPLATNVKTGVAYSNSELTGSYTGSDRWTDPGEANVKVGVAYKADSTSNNKTGTMQTGSGKPMGTPGL